MKRKPPTDEQRAQKNARQREKRRADPSKNRATVAAWASLNKERKSKADATWREANIEAMRMARAAWKRANPDRVRAHKQKRRGADGALRGDIVARLMSLQRGRCPYCMGDLRRSGNHIDHVVPIAGGGSNTDGNVQLLCPPCNIKKGRIDPIEFAQANGRLL